MRQSPQDYLARNLRLVWARATLSKVTIAYVLFTIIHCAVQVGLQSEAFVINNQADSFLKSIVRAAGFPVPAGINILVKNGPLYLCTDTTNVKACQTVWSPKSGSSTNANTNTIYGSSSTVVASSATATESDSTGGAYYAAAPTGTGSASFGAAVVMTGAASSISFTSTSPATPAVTSTSGSSSSAPSSTATYIPKIDTSGIIGPSGFIPLRRGLLPSFNVAAQSAPDVTGRSLRVDGARFDSNKTLEFVSVSGFHNVPAVVASNISSGVADLPPACVKVLAWPLQNLATSGREDVVFLSFNIWALGMSFMAVLNESMPHMIAAVITHILLTAWTVFQLFTTNGFRSEFLRITRDGACQGLNLLPTFWTQRFNIEIAELALNIAALLLSIFLSWKLVKQFGWQTFKRVGASLSVNHMYKLVLGLSVVLQLALFFIVSSLALWVDQICNGPAAAVTKHSTAYQAFYLVIIALLVPWATCGWFGVRRESKELTLVFLIGATSIITSWGGMFFSHTFRLLFVTWGFFAMIAVFAMFLSGVTMVLGIACRLKFGQNAKNLAQYLKPDEESMSEKKRDYSDDLGFNYGETVQFPGSDVPTYDSIMKQSGALLPQHVSTGARVPLHPLTMPPDAHTVSGPRSASSSPFSSPSRLGQANSDGSSTYVESMRGGHSRMGSAVSEARSDRSSPVGSGYKKQWVIE